MTDLISGAAELCGALWGSMADLADRIDDLICSFEGGGDSAMDTLAMLVFGWTVIILFVLALVKYLYKRFLSKEIPPPVDNVKVPVPVSEPVVEEVKPVPAPTRSSGGKFVPPTPPLRKRLTTKKVPTTLAPTHHTPLPTATGPDPQAVKYVNQLLAWLYSDLVILNELLTVWITTLNDFAKRAVAEHGVGVEVVRILPETAAPHVTNIFCEAASNDDITITCDCDATPALQVKGLRQRGERVEVSHYRLNVNRFRARLNVVCVTEKLLADVRCDGWPDIKVALAPVGPIKNQQDELALREVIADILVTAMRTTQVNLNLQQYPSCPRFSRYLPPPANILPVHYDSMAEEMAAKSRAHPVPPPEQNLADKRLLVKIVGAQGLGMSCQDPYCVVEMDEPSQKNQTCVKKNTRDPVWDEHFLFDINSSTGELLLEIYDRTSKAFLGLGMVGIEELISNPSQRQTISLQSRPFQNDQVSGSLTIELRLVEGAEVPIEERPYKLKETLRSITPSGNLITTSKTVFSGPTDRISNGGETVADSALQAIQSAPSSPANKTTLIIHSVQREASVRGEPTRLKVQKTGAGTWHEVDTTTTPPQTTQNAMQEAPMDQDFPETGRGRSRRRKRDFFGTIKRRLGGRGRSKSVGPDQPSDQEDPLTRSISADRARDPSAHSTGRAVPSLRVTDGEISRRSSISDLSGFSGASTRTYINEASTLVLETIENGIKKHYLIPLSLAQKNKWRKKGTKLHIFNEHTFVAKHLPAKTTCQVCATLIPRRFGKQGYECRDCLIQCHKPCHIRADHTCPQSTIQNIELQKFLPGNSMKIPRP